MCAGFPNSSFFFALAFWASFFVLNQTSVCLIPLWMKSYLHPLFLPNYRAGQKIPAQIALIYFSASPLGQFVVRLLVAFSVSLKKG